jgi:starvation-inducible DNA-binding protein
MQTIISDLLAIAALSKEVHWNSRGQGFIAVHRYLDEVFDSAMLHVDQIAEHMASTGVYGDPRFDVGDFETFPQLLIRKDPQHVHTGVRELVVMITTFTEDLEQYLANETDDPAGQDYVVRCLQEFNKHLWFLSGELA